MKGDAQPANTPRDSWWVRSALIAFSFATLFWSAVWWWFGPIWNTSHRISATAPLYDTGDDIRWGRSFTFALDGVEANAGTPGTWWVTAVSDSDNARAEAYTRYRPNGKATDDHRHVIDSSLRAARMFGVDVDDVAVHGWRNDRTLHGTSAGLISTLAILDGAVGDLAGGLKVGGTGVVDVDGQVIGVGAVPEKLQAAVVAELDVFFVPQPGTAPLPGSYRGNGTEGGAELVQIGASHRTRDGVAVINVADVGDALWYLCGRGSVNACGLAEAGSKHGR